MSCAKGEVLKDLCNSAQDAQTTTCVLAWRTHTEYTRHTDGVHKNTCTHTLSLSLLSFSLSLCFSLTHSVSLSYTPINRQVVWFSPPLYINVCNTWCNNAWLTLSYICVWIVVSCLSANALNENVKQMSMHSDWGRKYNDNEIFISQCDFYFVLSLKWFVWRPSGIG